MFDRRIWGWWGCACAVGLGLGCLLSGGCALVQKTVLELDDEGNARVETTGWQVGDHEMVAWSDPVTGAGFASLSSDRSGTRWFLLSMTKEVRAGYLEYLRLKDPSAAAGMLERWPELFGP